jgi:hypothetical protein
MNGQWNGTYTGTNSSGNVALDLDDVGTHYAGQVFLVANDASLHPVAADVLIPKGQSTASFRVTGLSIDRRTGNLVLQADGSPQQTQANTEWELGPTEISIKWRTDDGATGDGKVANSEADRQSELAVLPVATWVAFKEFASGLEPYRYLFRGQENNRWRLRTSFHRTGRASLARFNTQDLKTLHRHLSGLTTHRFNLLDPLDNAAFLNLVQHHGYPTPLLDWTLSPFIGAYFAFRTLRRGNVAPDQRVRIFVLDGRQWANDWEAAPTMSPAFRHLTLLEPLAINNPRATPQQSVSSVTNIDDIEMYIKTREAIRGNNYLRAIDLPADERRTAMQELALMGVNAGSLFPGLDGACEQLRERFFSL